MTQVELGIELGIAPTKETRPSIEERYTAFVAANPAVFAEALRLACARLDRGETYISVKALYEELRVSLSTTREGGYRLNNDFTAPLARALLDAEPRLLGVIELRRRRT